MTDQEMRKFVSDYVRAINGKDVRGIERYHADDAEVESYGEPGKRLGRAERQRYFEERNQAFPDAKMTATNIQVDAGEGRASFDWTIHATHRGHFKGMAPTHKPVRHSGTTELLIRGGRIVQEVSRQNLEKLVEQMRA